MRYFSYEKSEESAILKWNMFQQDFVDVVLFLSDRNILWGEKIYNLFCRSQIRNLLIFFSCNLAKIKEDLGIKGNYVWREENIFSKDYNPKRDVFSVAPENLELRGMLVYDRILKDLEEICEYLKNRKST